MLRMFKALFKRADKKTLEIPFKRLNESAEKPTRAYNTDAGFDLVVTSLWTEANEPAKFFAGTGLAVNIPKGYVGLVFPRSSIHKTDLRLSNAVGVIDAGYTGEIKAVFDITAEGQGTKFPLDLYTCGERCLQLIILKLPEVSFKEVQEFETTARGVNGFGSTGNELL